MTVDLSANGDCGELPRDLSPLWSAMPVGSLQLKGRLVHPAVIGNYGVDGRVSERQLAYYSRIAKGGVDLIVTEGVSIHPTTIPSPRVIRLFEPASHAGLRRMAEVAHEADVPILLQLWHVGRQQLWGSTNECWGVSAEPDPLSGTSPHVMDDHEVRQLVTAFVEGAVAAKALGFDGVELHGAHGYLITQMLSPWTNMREGRYGGSVQGRLQFLREVVDGIRAANGPDFALSLKLSGSEFVAGGLTSEDTADVIRQLASDSTIDMFAIGQGNFSLSLEKHVPDMHFPEATFADMIAELRAAANGVPVMALGRIVDPYVAADLVARGVADLIGMARALVSDPDLPNKARAGAVDTARRCISCNVCWGAVHRGREMYCIHNPELARREAADRSSSQRVRQREVHVVGGGPAGLECAWRAARAGHHVTVWERRSSLGGQLTWLASAPGLADYARILDYQRFQLERYRVEVRTESPVSPEQLDAWDPADVVLAIGSAPDEPPTWLAGLDAWSPDDDRWLSTPAMSPKSAIVVDEAGSYYAYAPVVRLIEAGCKVTLVSSHTDPAWNMDYLSRIGMIRYLRSHGVMFLGGVGVAGVSESGLEAQDLFSRITTVLEPPAILVWATHRRAVTLEGGRQRGIRMIGDAYAPRDIASAIEEGSRAAADL